MPEADSSEAKQFHPEVPQENHAFFVKGAGAYDWGMQNRLARIFRPASGHTVMLAVDHGYFQGPTTGLERIDLNILPLVPYADALMLTRGVLRSMIPPTIQQGFVVRASGGPSILKELSNEHLAMDVEDAVRLGAAAMAVQVFVGGEFETQTVSQHDPARRRRVAPRDPGPGRDGGRQGARPRRAIPRAWRPGCVPSSAPKWSRPTTATTASRRSRPGVPCPS